MNKCKVDFGGKPPLRLSKIIVILTLSRDMSSDTIQVLDGGMVSPSESSNS